MSQLVNIFLSKITFVILFLIVQLFVLYELILYFHDNFAYIYFIIEVSSLLSVVYLINKQEVSEIKIGWIVCIMMLPVFGVTLYLLLGKPILNKNYQNRLKRVEEQAAPYIQQNHKVMHQLHKQDVLAYTQSYYIYHTSKFPVYTSTTTEYLPLGEVKLRALKEELRKAKYYIFLQYFIIKQGQMWNEILAILEEKVKEGIEVRVMYDDAGCISNLPYRYDKILQEKGISCVIINPLRPALNIVLQNRDHRKIVVIDGIVGFTGGINIGDEYINAYAKLGHWKDCAVLIKGDAVKSLLVSFLETWNFYHTKESEIAPFISLDTQIDENETGFIQPYSDTPLDQSYLSQRIYLNILNQAKKYVYINTPYFIMDQAFLDEITCAAKRGIDIRIVTPHIPDKWYVHIMTRSYYKELINAGVQVYEYTPGFIHSKTFVSDDTIGTVGTVNLDYRSMYHNFECGVWMYKTTAVTQLRDDFLSTLEVCTKMNVEDCTNEKWYRKVFVFFFKIITPLL